MTYSTLLDVTLPVPGAAKAPHSGFWASGHYLWEIVGYTAAGLIVLAIAPVLFIVIDRAAIVQWCNAILDLVSLR